MLDLRSVPIVSILVRGRLQAPVCELQIAVFVFVSTRGAPKLRVGIGSRPSVKTSTTVWSLY